MNEIVEVKNIVPAEVNGTNIDEFVDVMLPMLKAKKQEIVILDRNDLTGVKKIRAGYNKEKKELEDLISSVKTQATYNLNIWETKAKQVVAVYKELDTHFGGLIKTFEDAEKAEKKADIDITIKSRLHEAVENEELDANHASQFEFNQKWLNATVKFKEIEAGIDVEINRLSEKYSSFLENVKFIKAYIAKVESEQNCAGIIDADVYIELFTNGMSSADVMARIDYQISRLNVITVQAENKPVESRKPKDEQLVIDITNALEKAENMPQEKRDKEYHRTYHFRGNALSLMIVKQFMDMLESDERFDLDYEMEK